MSPSSPNEEDTASSSSVQLPPPPASGTPGEPVPSAAYPAYPAYPAAPTLAPGRDDREYRPGTNGLAIAALCCGIAGLMPVAAVVGIVLGFVALGQLRRVVQNGRGMAIAGIVLGSLWLVLVVGGIAAFSLYGPTRSSSSGFADGEVFDTTKNVTVNNLEVGDCFDGLPAGDGTGQVGVLVRRSCAETHEGQMAASVTLAGAWPGRDKAVEAAGSACSDALAGVVRPTDLDALDLVFVGPTTESAWQYDLGVVCVVQASVGSLDHSVLLGH
ncbi:DUF4190 domain-containing protein [Intrasporangium sp. YIM S08009]|uniref:DUF4190 domain-containing protein n=1 Tax=Intrasporangium zincisolvens TaxID=3080018 RepID=UPI002B06014A|nr:DUF4190 domain-containing protein [Intrasporangium sp. YIM S08009]